MTSDMITTVEQKSCRIFGPALVLTVDDEKRKARIYYTDGDGLHGFEAHNALQFPNLLSVGDRVLVSGEAPGKLYITGVLSRAYDDRKMVAPGGVSVRIVNQGNTSVIQLLSPQNQLIVEYDCESKKTRITGEGDVEVRAAGDRLNLVADKEIALFSSQVSVRGQSSVSLAAGAIDSEISGAQLHLNQRQLELKSMELNLSGQRGAFHFGECRMFARRLVAKALQVGVFAEKVETTAGSMISRAKDWYQTATNLVQIRSGRLRLLSDATYYQKSRSSIIKAEEDVKVKAEKIHLG